MSDYGRKALQSHSKEEILNGRRDVLDGKLHQGITAPEQEPGILPQEGNYLRGDQDIHPRDNSQRKSYPVDLLLKAVNRW
jgi:hypothetical protein